MATIRLVQSVKNPGNNVFATSVSVTLKQAPAVGNLLFLVLGTDKNTGALGVPSGFTKIQSEEAGANAGGLIAWKIADGSETTLTCTITASGVSKPGLAVFEYDGFTGTPVDVSSKTNSGATNVGSAATSAITTTAANTTVFAVCIIDSMPPEWGGNRAWSNSFTELEAWGVGSNAACSIAVRQFTSTQTGLTTTHSWTAATDQAVTFAVAFIEDGSDFPSSTAIDVDDSATAANLYQNFSAYSATASTSYTVRLPRAAKANHVLVAVVGVGANASGFAATGWTVLKTHSQTTHSSCLMWKLAAGGEKDIAFSWTGSGIPTITVLEYSGMRTTSVLGAYHRSVVTTTASSLATPSISTTSSKSLILVANIADAQATASPYLNSTWSNSFVNVEGNCEGTANVPAMLVAQKIVTGASTSVNSNFTNAGAADEMQAFIVEFASADGSAATETDVENNTVATPTFSPVAGTYSGTQNVSILCATSGATIHYTTNGTTPTTGSPTYSTPISVSTTQTIKALAVKATMVDSAIATGLFTITAGAALVQQVEAESSGAFVGTITATFAAPATAGNVLVFFAAIDKTNSITSGPSGFTLIDSSLNTSGFAAYYKIAAGGETAMTLTLGNAGISKPCAWAGEYSGMDTASLIGQTNKANSAAATVQTINPGSITCAKTFSLVIAFATADSWISSAWDSGSWSNSFNPIAFVGSTTGGSGKAPIAVASKAFVSGNSASSAFTTTQTADEMAGLIVEFGTLTDGTAGGGPSPNTPLWCSSGGVTSSSAQIIYGMTNSGNVSLGIYNDNNDLVATLGPTATTTEGSNNLVKFNATGLNPSHRYKYIPNDGLSDYTSMEGFFNTAPAVGTATSFNFVHYSCNSLPNNARFLDFIAKTPKFVACLGDWHYNDINSATESNYHASFTTNYTSANHLAQMKYCQFVRVWDDHDFSGNDSNSTATGRTASAAVFRKFHACYTFPDGVAIYHSFVWGRVRFVMMDSRSERVPSGTPVTISTTQMAWVKAEIKAAKDAGQVVVLATSFPWISAETTSDNWGNTTYGTTQRAELGTYIRQQQMNRSIFIISGDAHMLAFDDGTNNTYGTGGGVNFRVFQGAALGRTGSIKGGPYSGGSKASVSGNEGDGQYANVIVTDTGGKTISFVWDSYTTADAIWNSVPFTLNVPPKAKARAIITG